MIDLSTRDGAIKTLVAFSLIFFAAAMWVQLYFPTQSAFGNRLWDLFSMTLGGVLVILKADASNLKMPAPPPAQPQPQGTDGGQ